MTEHERPDAIDPEVADVVKRLRDALPSRTELDAFESGLHERISRGGGSRSLGTRGWIAVGSGLMLAIALLATLRSRESSEAPPTPPHRVTATLPRTRGTPATSAPAPSVPAVPAARAAPHESSTVSAPAGAAAAPVARPSPLVRPPDDLAEGELLSRARALVTRDPDRALALVHLHARRYMQSVLSEEREVIEIDALAAKGETVAAHARAETFLHTRPESVHVPHVRSVLNGLHVE